MPKGMISWNYPNLTPPDREKKPYERGPSILDVQDENSSINKSDFKGFYNMTVIFALIFLFTKPILNKIEHGYFLEPNLYHTFQEDFILCIMVWPLFFLWSFTSYFLQILILRGIPNWFAHLYQHATQSGLFIFASYMILKNDWCATHASFVILQACTHFMKMHSYTTVNRDYRGHLL